MGVVSTRLISTHIAGQKDAHRRLVGLPRDDHGRRLYSPILHPYSRTIGRAPASCRRPTGHMKASWHSAESQLNIDVSQDVPQPTYRMPTGANGNSALGQEQSVTTLIRQSFERPLLSRTCRIANSHNSAKPVTRPANEKGCFEPEAASHLSVLPLLPGQCISRRPRP